MGLVLDTSVLITAEKKDFDLSKFLILEAPQESVFITTITASELLHGVHRANGKRRLKREIFVEEILNKLFAIPFDLLSARTHSRIWADLESKGKRIGSHDLVIASICMTLDYRLATLNEGEFQKVDGLQLADTAKYRINDD